MHYTALHGYSLANTMCLHCLCNDFDASQAISLWNLLKLLLLMIFFSFSSCGPPSNPGTGIEHLQLWNSGHSEVSFIKKAHCVLAQPKCAYSVRPSRKLIFFLLTIWRYYHTPMATIGIGYCKIHVNINFAVQGVLSGMCWWYACILTNVSSVVEF